MNKDSWADRFLKQLGIGAAMKPRWSYAPKRETTQYYELFHTSPRLDALYMLASDIANAKYKLYPKAGKRFDEEQVDPIRDHAIYDVLDNPMPGNPEMDEFTLHFLTNVYRELIGEAFWLLERNNAGLPVEVYPVPPNWVLTTPTDVLPYFMVVPMGNTSHKPLPVQPSDVVWFKDANIGSPFGRGRARTEAIGDELESDEYAAKYGKNYFYNDATPPIVIEAPGATQEQAEAFKASWVQKLGGFINARKPAIIPWKDSKITKLADSVREMDFVESRKFLRDVCNQHWSLPPELAGILENSNRSTIDSAYYLWTKNVVTKRIERYESALNRQFVPLFDKNIKLVYDSVVPDDKEFELQMLNSGLSSGVVTVNEWRKKNGLPMDVVSGDVYLRAFNIMPVPLKKDVPKVNGATTGDDDQEQNNGTEAQSSTQIALNGAKVTSLVDLVTAATNGLIPIDSARAIASAAFPDMTDDLDGIFGPIADKLNNVSSTCDEPSGKPVDEPAAVLNPSPGAGKSKAVRAFSDEARLAIWKTFDKTAQEVEGPFVEAVKKTAELQRKNLKRKFGSGAASTSADLTAMVDKAIGEVFTITANEKLKALFEPAWATGMKVGFDNAEAILGKGAKSKDAGNPVWDYVSPFFRKWIDEMGLTRAEGINDTTNESLRKKIATSMAEGIDAGESIPKLRNRILDATDNVYDEMDTVRATLIARTETIATVNFGQFQTYKGEGVEKKEWLATMDDRTRQDHLDANGQIVGIDDDFSVGADHMTAPGLGELAAENIQCRCTVIPVIEE